MSNMKIKIFYSKIRVLANVQHVPHFHQNVISLVFLGGEWMFLLHREHGS